MKILTLCFSVWLVLLCIAGNGKAQSLTFALISDTHIGSSTASEDLERTVADINERPEISFAILPGDITELGWDDELREAKRILDKLQVAWYVSPGNHDTKWSESGCNSFRQIFGYERFEFDAGGYKFVGCSSGPNMRMAPGLIPQEDLVWLDSITRSIQVSRQPLIFINHYPMDKGLANWYKVLEMLRRVNTQAILCGHGHRNKAYDFAGIPGVMGRSNLRARADTGGYNIVTIQGDSMYFSSCTPGGQPEPAWRKFALKDPAAQPLVPGLEGPSYAINGQYPRVEEVWSIQDKSDIGAGVICRQNRCYYTNTAGRLIAIDQQNGEKIWEFESKGKIYATPALSKDKIVFASTDSVIYCIDQGDGSLAWSLKTGKAIVASPVIDQDQVYIGSSEGKFRSLDLQDGTLRWSFDGIQGFVECIPAIDEDRVYFGAWDTKFYALNKKNGSLVWTWDNGHASRLYSPAACNPVVAHDKVFIAAPDRYLTALDVRSGREVWRRNRYKGRESIALSADQSLFYVKTMQDTLVAFSTLSDQPEVAWTLDCGFGYEISPSASSEGDEIVYIPTDKGVIYAVDGRDVSVIWAHKISNALINNIVPLGNQEVVAASMDGRIVRLKFTGR